MAKLTKIEKAYLDNCCSTCPFCNSDAVFPNDISIEDGCASRGMECEECEKQWQEKYDFSGLILDW